MRNQMIVLPFISVAAVRADNADLSLSNDGDWFNVQRSTFNTKVNAFCDNSDLQSSTPSEEWRPFTSSNYADVSVLPF